MQELIVHELKLRNWKGIASLDLSLEEDLTVLCGRNGVGKTSIVEALLALATLQLKRWRSPRRSPRTAVVFTPPGELLRKGTDGGTATLTTMGGIIEIRFPGIVITNAELKMPQPEIAEFLFCYYGQDRLEKKNEAIRDDHIFFNSLNSATKSISHFKEWFFEKEGDEGREVVTQKNLKFTDPHLNSIRSIISSIDEFSEIKSRLVDNKRELLLTKNGIDVKIEELSSGERVYFILASDLARRLMVAYPDVPLEECHALIVIDEIELHLHPTWQRLVLTKMCEMFPKCQFVVTTHSPQVLGGVEARCVRLLHSDSQGNVEAQLPNSSKGRDSNFILDALLDAGERMPEVDNLIDRCKAEIDEQRFEDARKSIAKLRLSIDGGDAPIVSILEARIARLESA